MKNILILITFCVALMSCDKNISNNLGDTSINPGGWTTPGEWRVVSVTPIGSSTIFAADTYTLNLEDSRFKLILDVNKASGEIEVPKEGEIKFDKKITITEACCDSEFAENMLQQLIGMTKYSIDNDILVFSGNGTITLKQ